jgi:hypothetical protein
MLLQISGLKHNKWQHIRINDDIYFNKNSFCLLSNKWQFDFIDLAKIYNSYQKLNFILKYKEHSFEFYNNEFTYSNTIKKEKVSNDRSSIYYIICNKKKKTMCLFYKNKQLLLIKDFKIIFSTFTIERKISSLTISFNNFTVEHSLLTENTSTNYFKLLCKDYRISFSYDNCTNNITNFVCYKKITKDNISYIYYYNLKDNSLQLNINNGILYQIYFKIINEDFSIFNFNVNESNNYDTNSLQDIKISTSLKYVYKSLDNEIFINSLLCKLTNL